MYCRQLFKHHVWEWLEWVEWVESSSIMQWKSSSRCSSRGCSAGVCVTQTAPLCPSDCNQMCFTLNVSNMCLMFPGFSSVCRWRKVKTSGRSLTASPSTLLRGPSSWLPGERGGKSTFEDKINPQLLNPRGKMWLFLQHKDRNKYREV